MKIACILTNRTNYSKLKLVLQELTKHDHIELDIIASSSVLLEKYGMPYKDVEKDGFKITEKIDCLMMNDSHEAMVKTAGVSLIEHANHYAHERPDLLLVVGDRYDAFPGSFAAAMMNIPIAHIQGGEVTGTIDDRIRDLISQIATLHFVATEKSGGRLQKWGLSEDSIFNYGCPAVDYISKIDIGTHFDASRIDKKFKRPIEVKPGEKYFLVMVHPDTTNEEDVNMENILEAVSEFKMKTFIFYPNTDAHNSRILAGISKFRNNDDFYAVRHMPLDGFVHTMAHAAVMIGNSSAGIREAALFGTPVINIGERQGGRERNSNTIDLVNSDTGNIKATIARLKDRRFEKNNIYFKPECSFQIAQEIMSYVKNKRESSVKTQ